MSKIRRMWENGRVRLLTPNGKALYAALLLESKWGLRTRGNNCLIGLNVISMSKSTGHDIELTISYWFSVVSAGWYGFSDVKFSFLDWCLLQAPAYKLYRNLNKPNKKSAYCNTSFIEICAKSAVTGDLK